MPIWPIWMTISACLTLWGALHNAWVVPAMALAGYIGTRLIIYSFDPSLHEVAICSLWLIVASGMMYQGAWIPGFFFTLSALTYPLLLPVGFRIEYMSLMPIMADIFAVLALLSIGGGIFGISRASLDSGKPYHWVVSHSSGVAARKEEVAGAD